jgi:ribosomal protein S12 methylthiotransferase accessory factor
MSTQTIEIVFPGAKQVDARIGNFVIHTDQAEEAGGSASAPEPFDLFLASIATCAGIFALNFCQARNIDTQGLGLRMECERDPVRKLFSCMRLRLALPAGFPEKYRGGIVKAIELCTVKRHILDSPKFQVVFDDVGDP